MKRVILSFVIAAMAAASSFAQPVLDSAAICPVPKDVFIGHMPSITAGILPGASGPGATWNFATLTDDSQDSTVYFTCAATPFCSSFSSYGSNLACYTDNGIIGAGYYYFTADSNLLTVIGGNVSSITAHTINGLDAEFFSLLYMKTHLDTTEAVVTGYYHYQQDSSIVDGYGNLTLPTGTFTNVMRVLTVSMQVDSLIGSAPDTTYVQDYNWYVAGFHNPILDITIDTTNGNTVEYYTKGVFVDPSLQSALVVQPHTLQIFPNPATNEVNMKFDLRSTGDAVIAITDVTGRVVGTVPGTQMKQGINNITFPVSGLPGGVYTVRLTSGTESISQKIVVAK